MKILNVLKALKLVQPKKQPEIKPISETVNDNIKDYRATKTARMLIYLVVFLVLSGLVYAEIIPYQELLKFIVQFL